MGPFCLSKVIGCVLLGCIASSLSSLATGSAAAQEADVSQQASSEAEQPAKLDPANTPEATEAAEPTSPATEEAATEEASAGVPATDADTTDAATTNASTDTESADTESDGLPELGKLSYEPHIREIFAAHCSECHGAKAAKADLRVDDRDSLLSYVAPGDLESSSLWGDYLVTTDSEMRMPPIKYGKPLSPLELAAIRVWIEDGAEWPDRVEPPVVAAVVAPVATASAPPRSFVQKSWTFVGFFHPAVVHLPIGLLLVSTLFTVLAFVKRETFEPAAFHCLWIGAAGAIAASFAGWAFADIRGYGDFWSTEWDKDLIARHRISGVAVTAAAILLALVAVVARRRTRSDLRFVWLAGALVLAGLVSLVGHQGGELTYGEELFSRAYEQSFGDLPPTQTPTTGSPTTGSHTSATENDSR